MPIRAHFAKTGMPCMTHSVLGNGRVCIWFGKLIALWCRNKGQEGKMLILPPYLPLLLTPFQVFLWLSPPTTLAVYLPQCLVSRASFVPTYVWRSNEKVLLLSSTVCNERPRLFCMTQTTISTNLIGTRQVNRGKHVYKCSLSESLYNKWEKETQI